VCIQHSLIRQAKQRQALLFTGFFFLACLYASRMNETKKKMYGKEELLIMMSHIGVLSTKTELDVVNLCNFHLIRLMFNAIKWKSNKNELKCVKKIARERKCGFFYHFWMFPQFRHFNKHMLLS